MDCGMSLCANLNNDKEGPCFGEINGGIRIIRKLCTLKKQPVLQKLIIKHGNLKKLSLWGCSAIDVSLGILSALVHPNAYLKSCTNLHPGIIAFDFSLGCQACKIVSIIFDNQNCLSQNVCFFSAQI
jgi:hypothetical protein